jgi:hypothetical protein
MIQMSDVNRQFISNYSSTTARIGKKGFPRRRELTEEKQEKSLHILTNMMGKVISGRRPGS